MPTDSTRLQAEQAFKRSLRMVIRHPNVAHQLLKAAADGGIIVLDEVPGLVGLLISDTGRAQRYLMTADLKAVGLDGNQAAKLAHEQTLALLQPLLGIEGEGPWRITADGTYESSLLLAPDLLAQVNKRIHGRTLIASPTPNLLVVADSADRDQVRKVQALVDSVFDQGAPHLLTRDLFELDGQTLYAWRNENWARCRNFEFRLVSHAQLRSARGPDGTRAIKWMTVGMGWPVTLAEAGKSGRLLDEDEVRATVGSYTTAMDAASDHTWARATPLITEHDGIIEIRCEGADAACLAAYPHMWAQLREGQGVLVASAPSRDLMLAVLGSDQGDISKLESRTKQVWNDAKEMRLTTHLNRFEQDRWTPLEPWTDQCGQCEVAIPPRALACEHCGEWQVAERFFRTIWPYIGGGFAAATLWWLLGGTVFTLQTGVAFWGLLWLPGWAIYAGQKGHTLTQSLVPTTAVATRLFLLAAPLAFVWYGIDWWALIATGPGTSGLPGRMRWLLTVLTPPVLLASTAASFYVFGLEYGRFWKAFPLTPHDQAERAARTGD